jgi:hypothetical protein
MPCLLLILIAVFAGGDALTQAPTRFRARLSTVPIDLVMQKTVAGRGEVNATLAGVTLTLSGEFHDLVSPSTIARLHQGPNKGIRGPSIHELTLTTGRSGSIGATLTLTPSQLDALKLGHLYVQLHSQDAPDGNLWGWLLPEGRR